MLSLRHSLLVRINTSNINRNRRSGIRTENWTINNERMHKANAIGNQRFRRTTKAMFK